MTGLSKTVLRPPSAACHPSVGARPRHVRPASFASTFRARSRSVGRQIAINFPSTSATAAMLATILVALPMRRSSRSLARLRIFGQDPMDYLFFCLLIQVSLPSWCLCHAGFAMLMALSHHHGIVAGACFHARIAMAGDLVPGASRKVAIIYCGGGHARQCAGIARGRLCPSDLIGGAHFLQWRAGLACDRVGRLHHCFRA